MKTVYVVSGCEYHQFSWAWSLWENGKLWREIQHNPVNQGKDSNAYINMEILKRHLKVVLFLFWKKFLGHNLPNRHASEIWASSKHLNALLLFMEVLQFIYAFQLKVYGLWDGSITKSGFFVISFSKSPFFEKEENQPICRIYTATIV